MQLDIHDKAVNADSLQRLWSYGRNVPLGVIVPANNRWVPDAFVAEADESSNSPAKRTRVLIIDDHYRGSDPTYRHAGDLIGDELSDPLLCSLKQQARQKSVKLDEAVITEINGACSGND